MARRHVFRTWDDYFIPGTSVLRNKFTGPGTPCGETDPVRLRSLEEFHARSRLIELAARPIEGCFDYAHMKAIHRYVFQDVYEWAGQERVGPATFMVKTGLDVVHFEVGDPRPPRCPTRYYPAGPELGRAAEEQYRRLADQYLLLGLDHDAFAVALAEVWGELNVIHSFREGNTRSQFVFFSQLAAQAGWRLEPARFVPGTRGREEFVAARFYSQATGSNDRLAQVLAREIVPAASLGRHERQDMTPERLRAQIEERASRLYRPEDDGESRQHRGRRR